MSVVSGVGGVSNNGGNGGSSTVTVTATVTTTNLYPAASTTTSIPVPGGSQSHSSNKGSKGQFGVGALAGTAVGCLLGGAIIAALITWMFLRRKRNHKRGRKDSHREAEKNFVEVNAVEVPEPAILQAHKWEQHLPQPSDDSSLRMSMKTLYHQVELHVENFYSDTDLAGAPLPEEVQRGIEQFDGPELPAAAATLIQQSGSPTAVIKHCLMKHIVSAISVEEMGQVSFLPVEFTALPLAMRDGIREHKPGAREAYSQWRVLTAYLRPDTNADHRNEEPYITGRDSAIQQSALNASAVFNSWATSRQADASRVQSLVEIMRSAAQLGIIIFSQASDFQYTWVAASNGRQSRARNSRTIVVTPGFVKVTDEKGRPLSHGHIIVPPVTADLGARHEGGRQELVG